MRRSALLFLRPRIRRLAAVVVLGLGAAGLSACASDQSGAPASGSSVAGAGGWWTRPGYKLDWSKPDFGGPPPGSH